MNTNVGLCLQVANQPKCMNYLSMYRIHCIFTSILRFLFYVYIGFKAFHQPESIQYV